MIVISVRVCGDHWLNPEQVEAELSSTTTDQTIVLDLHTEGASLTALGIKEMLDRYCTQSQRDPKSLHIINWPNLVEQTDYTIHTNPAHISHFFWFSDRYRPENCVPPDHTFRFGFFVGRRTVPRCVMFWQHWQSHASTTLFSLMESYFGTPASTGSGIDLEKLQDWLSPGEIKDFEKWWQNCAISSIDSHHVRDQYRDTCNTNLDLLQHYNKFDIEIVCESYTRGSSFFVTEKTIRPLCAGRPVLLYGPRHFLKHLRALGFRTWQEIWDESYDDVEGPARWRQMQKVIQDISNLDQLRLWNQCQEICLHNYLLVGDLAQKRKPQ